MEILELIRCSSCEQRLDPECFAPSHRKEGDWCRACRSEYMRAWKQGYKPTATALAKRAARQEAKAEANRNRPRTCRDCGTTFIRWDNYRHPGSAISRCRECYNVKSRERYWKDRTPRSLPIHGPRLRSGPGWKRMRQDVLDSETHCGICGGYVDRTVLGTHPDAPSVDHIIPIDDGGDHLERSNVQLAHFGCNARKGQQYWKLRALELISKYETPQITSDHLFQ